MSESVRIKVMSAYVDGVIARMELREYIRNFNAPGGGKIACLSDFLITLDYDKALDARYDEARRSAPGDVQAFDEAIRAKLQPLIMSTFLIGVLDEARLWAVDLASSDPDCLDAPAPFDSEDAFVDWAIDNVEEPIGMCDPDAGPVLEDDALQVILRQALRAERIAAIKAGWLKAPVVLQLHERRAQPVA